MKIPLAIYWAKTPERPAVAWLVAGSSPCEWLEKFAAWGISLEDVELYVLSRGERSAPCAVLAALGPRQRVTNLPEQSANKNETAIARSHFDRGTPYGLIGERLFVPVDARFNVPLSTGEVKSLLPNDDEVYVWQPGEGITAFQASDVLRVGDLLAPRREVHEQWTFAEPGVQLPSVRLSIEAETPPMRVLIRRGGDDIGEKPLSAEDLPPSPLEHQPGMTGALGRAMSSAAAKASLWFTSLWPRGGKDRTWVNDWEDWAKSALGQLASSLQAERHREIARLLHMLDKDPDKGLQYAIPFGGDNQRGIAPAGSSLHRRDVDFRLNSGRSGPADGWNIPTNYHYELQQRYRDLARREIALGRHRRAAYIYAELLGDWNSAAHTLSNGNHHREAAAIYRERLGRTADAAKCLEAGGLYVEAIECYTEIREFEKVGDLYVILENEAEAREAFTKSVSEKCAVGDNLSAARITETKLRDPDGALEHLEMAWPRTAQAVVCMTERFRLLGRMERHADAHRSVGDLAKDWPNVPALPEVLATVAGSYPEAAVRDRAADQTRVVAARRLTSCVSMGEVDVLTNLLSGLAPGDILLGRDCRRFREAARQRSELRYSEYRYSAPRAPGVTLVNEFHLRGGEFRAVHSLGANWVAVAAAKPCLHVFRGNWHGHHEVAPGWALPAEHENRPILLAAPEAHARGIVVHIAGAPPLHGHRRFAPTDAMPEAWHARSSNGVDASTWAIAYGSDGTLFLIRRVEFHLLELKIIDLSQRLVRTRAIDLAKFGIIVDESLEQAPVFAIRGGTAYLAIDNVVLVVDTKVTGIEAPAPISALILSRQHVRDRMIVAHAEGGTIFWGAKYDGREERFCHDAEHPVIGITQSGLLVAVTANRIEVYRAHDGHLKLRNEADYSGERPLAVLATASPDEFAVFEHSGRVRVYRVPA